MILIFIKNKFGYLAECEDNQIVLNNYSPMGAVSGDSELKFKLGNPPVHFDVSVVSS